MAQQQAYYLGIEATRRTVALLAGADGEIIGEGQAGPSVYSVMGQERTEQALWTAIIAAFGSAGFNTRDMLRSDQPLPQVATVCVGMTGVERPKDESQVRRLLAKFNLSSNIIVTGEAHIVLETGCLPPDRDQDEPAYGVALLGGDSGLAFAKARDGQTAQAGGGGYLAGDEGSAHYIGLQAVRAVLRAADGRDEPTVLAVEVEREWKLPAGRPDTLVQRLHSLLAGLGSGGNKAQMEDTVESYKRALAALVGPVERAAAGGDPAAGRLLDRAAEELAQAARAVIARTGLAAGPAPSPAPAYKIGGLSFDLGLIPGRPKILLAIYGSALLTNAGELRRRLAARLPECDSPVAVLNPAEGALKLALLGRP